MEALIGPAISLGITFLAAAVAWGRITQRLETLEQKTKKLEEDSTALNRELSDIKISLAAINSKLEFLINRFNKEDH